MAKEQNSDIFGGFEQVFEDLSLDASSKGNKSNVSKEDFEDLLNDEEVVELFPEDEVKDPKDVEEVVGTDKDEVDEEKDEDEDLIDEPIDVIPNADEEEDVTEEDIVSTFFDLFSTELGWKTENEDAPKSMKELLSFMEELVAEASEPKYHSDKIKALDEYVKNGGNIDEFFKQTRGDLDLDNLDIAKESNQKKVIREYLRAMEYSDTYIDKKLNRYEESGVLEEEAEDALELLKEHKSKVEQKLLKEQEKLAEERIKQQQKFVSDVQNIIKSSDTILNIKLNNAQKTELTDYLFKVESDGRTAYQKDYTKDPLALVETALLLKEKENLFKKIETKATTEVVNNLKNKIKNNKSKMKQQKAYESRTGGHFNLISAISSQLSNK